MQTRLDATPGDVFPPSGKQYGRMLASRNQRGNGREWRRGKKKEKKGGERRREKGEEREEGGKEERRGKKGEKKGEGRKKEKGAEGRRKVGRRGKKEEKKGGEPYLIDALGINVALPDSPAPRKQLLFKLPQLPLVVSFQLFLM